jgi:protocatechuate 3,4-dioxygenase beta subunit
MTGIAFMRDDDLPVGRILTRREALILFGGASLAALGGCSSRSKSAPNSLAGCIVRPERTEGPFFVDDQLNRSDIRSDPTDSQIRPGVLLQLTFNVSAIEGTGCVPLRDALVDVWQCDHAGIYSGVDDWDSNTVGKKFLRGYQVTDVNGQARFTTIYPGWYGGRAVHIHFKIRSPADSNSTYEFTSQLYFDDDLTDRVHAQAPYSERGQRTLRNADDGIYGRTGSQLLLTVDPQDEGYTSTFDLALEMA